ncbi:MAG: hypothetical protein ACRDSE_22135, partial [Pseudonocardiaceae bacterium]
GSAGLPPLPALRSMATVAVMLPILVPYHLDEYLPDLDVPVEPELTITRELPGDGVWERMATLYGEVAASVADTVRNDTVPLVMSGDCTTSLATVAGLQRAGLTPASDYCRWRKTASCPPTDLPAR